MFFFLIVAGAYWCVSTRVQNLVLLVASYVFYGWWDWRFLSLLLASSVVDFACGLLLQSTKGSLARKSILFVSALTNLGLLAAFKYFGFFIDSLQRVMEAIGIPIPIPHWEILLPVGISFYTFQTLSYTIDVYRGRIKATSRFLDFLLFVSFFPQLVAGPIERASHLLPQILGERRFSLTRVKSGAQLAIVGFFKKMVIADSLAGLVHVVYSDGTSDGLTVLLATYAFAFQIYCDFSGYTDIARGISRILGFDICENFRLPYFATNPSDFWQRWHISLSTWIRDYVYIPLGGNRRSHISTLRNLSLTMLLAGLWHGASLHFVAWGAYHGFLLLVFRLLAHGKSKHHVPVIHFGIGQWLRVVAFFQLLCFGWLIFRSPDMGRIFELATSLFSFQHWKLSKIDLALGYQLVILVLPLLCFQVYQFRRSDMEPWLRWRASLQVVMMLALFYAIVLFGATDQNEFIYFQF